MLRQTPSGTWISHNSRYTIVEDARWGVWRIYEMLVEIGSCATLADAKKRVMRRLSKDASTEAAVSRRERDRIMARLDAGERIEMPASGWSRTVRSLIRDGLVRDYRAGLIRPVLVSDRVHGPGSPCGRPGARIAAEGAPFDCQACLSVL